MLCVGIINNIWGKRTRVKKNYTEGRTSPLFEITQTSFEITYGNDDHQNRNDSIREDQLEPTIENYDEVIDHEFMMARAFIEKKKQSKDINDRYRARIYDYSTTMYKNPRQFAKAVDIPYNAVLEAFNTFKEQLKNELHNNRDI